MRQENSNPKVEELEELIELAEVVSRKIEQLRDSTTHLRDKLLYQLFGVYVLIGLSALGFWRSLSMDQADYRLVGQMVLLATALFAIALFFRSFNAALRQRRKLSRETYVESEILDRLVEMIYDQMKIAQDSEELSPVSRALLSMRIQRLGG